MPEKRTPEEARAQLAVLDARLGVGVGAKRERERLLREMAGVKPKAKRNRKKGGEA